MNKKDDERNEKRTCNLSIKAKAEGVYTSNVYYDGEVKQAAQLE